MIRVSDHNNLLVEMFDIYPEVVQKVLPHQAQLQVLGTYDTDVEPSRLPTVVVCTEPTIDVAHETFAPLIERRPNSLWAVTHEKPGKFYQVPRPIFFPSNLCLTVRANDPTKNWTIGSKPYAACALLGGWGYERMHLFHALKIHGLLDRCLVNFRRRNISNVAPEHAEWYIDYQSPRIPELDDPRFQNAAYEQGGINTMRVTRFDIQDHTYISQIIPWQIYDQCWLNIVAETSYDSFLPSEKIGKPLLAGQPWVAFSGPGFLAAMRSLGFKTFDPWLDESYDNVQNVRDRAHAVVDSVIRFSLLSDAQKISMLKDMQPVLDHNRSLMLNTRHWYDPLVKSMVDLAK